MKTMLKENKWTLLISSLIILLPAFLRNSSSPFGTGLAPLFILAVHWVCVLITALDPGNKNQSRKVFGMIFWFCPIISVLIYASSYALASGMEFTSELMVTFFLGLLFLIVGNYMPKCRRNMTIGVKLPWTMASEDNWNHTHRLAGKVWVPAGLLIMLSVFFPAAWVNVLVPAIFIMAVLIPSIYSYCYYRKHGNEEGYQEAELSRDALTEEEKKKKALMKKSGAAAVAVILLFVIVLMFTGSISFTCREDALEIDASYWDDMEISYDSIESIAFRDADAKGTRVNGFGSAKLLMGSFRNEEFGYYTRYSYTGKDACIVMTVDGRTLVLGGESEEETEVLYQEILRKMEGTEQ